MNRPLIQRQWMLLTTSSEPPKCPHENPGKISLYCASVEKKCVLEVFPTCTCPSRAVFPPKVRGGCGVKDQHRAWFHRGKKRGSATARATMVLRACLPQWVTHGDSDNPSPGPGKLCLRFAAFWLLKWISCGRSGWGKGWDGTQETRRAPSCALASAGPAPAARQSKPT